MIITEVVQAEKIQFPVLRNEIVNAFAYPSIKSITKTNKTTFQLTYSPPPCFPNMLKNISRKLSPLIASL